MKCDVPFMKCDVPFMIRNDEDCKEGDCVWWNNGYGCRWKDT